MITLTREQWQLLKDFVGRGVDDMDAHIHDAPQDYEQSDIERMKREMAEVVDLCRLKDLELMIPAMLEDAALWLKGIRDGDLSDGTWPMIDEFIEDMEFMFRDEDA